MASVGLFAKPLLLNPASAADPPSAAAQTAPARVELTGADRANALDQLQKLRSALFSHASGRGVATSRVSSEGANSKFHYENAASLEVTFVFNDKTTLSRITNDDPKIGFVRAELWSPPVAVWLDRNAYSSLKDKTIAGYTWQIERFSSRAPAAKGTSPHSPGFARGDDWSYRAIVGLPEDRDEDKFFEQVRQGRLSVFRAGDHIVLYSEAMTPHLGHSSHEYIFSLAQGGVLLYNAYKYDPDSSRIYTYDWKQTPQGELIPAKFAERVTEISQDGKNWHVISRDVTFKKFVLGPVPGTDLSIRALGPSGVGIPAGTHVFDHADETPGHPAPSFIYSETAWKNIIGEDPAQEMGVPAPK